MNLGPTIVCSGDRFSHSVVVAETELLEWRGGRRGGRGGRGGEGSRSCFLDNQLPILHLNTNWQPLSAGEREGGREEGGGRGGGGGGREEGREREGEGGREREREGGRGG